MREQTHPFIKYGIAVVMRENNLLSLKEITREHLIREIENSRNHFRVKPLAVVNETKTVSFHYTDDQKGNPKEGVYLAPNILTTDMGAKNVFSSFQNVLKDLKSEKKVGLDVTRGITTVTGEYVNFGEKGTIGRGKSKVSVEVASFCLITNTTDKKPCLNFKSKDFENIAIIPNLGLSEMIDFINLFEKMKIQLTEKLMTGKINEKDNKPLRPKIYDGNFPNAPSSNSLGAVALLGAIGSWAKNAKDIEWSKKVLTSLEGVPIYLFGTKTFQTFKYNHFVIELAKENRLSSVVDSAYYTILYNKGRRNSKNRSEYDKYDMFLSRFLQLFSIPAFKDFLSFRAEYPNQFESLLNKYFINMEKIKLEVVKSARALGKWLNYAAYKVAERNIDSNVPDRNNKVRDQKAKSLIEIESSIFSARSGDALIFQAITRAGRASGLDAPAEAELFMTETSTGSIPLESAKHLLIAFSRVRDKYEKKTTNAIEDKDKGSDLNTTEYLSDAQE